jgi:hypothetical protein
MATLKEELERIEKEILKVELGPLKALRNSRYALIRQENEETLKALGITPSPRYAFPRGWDCPDSRNPSGFCCYDSKGDPAHDSCLFCGDPEERK